MKANYGSPLNELVSRAIAFYNKYRSPKSTAKLVEVEKDGFILEFEGAFCQSCGVSEYFNDFIVDLEKISRSVRAEINSIESAGPLSFKVQFIVRHDFSGEAVEEEKLFREFLHARGLSFEDYLTSNNCTKDVINFHFRTWLLDRKSEPKR